MNQKELQSDCEQKVKNLQTALESVTINDFQSIFLLKNYIECKKESIESVEKLIGYLETTHSKETET